VEFDADFGTPVHAAADGIILFAGVDGVATYSPWKNYYGNLVVIRHNDELYTLYAHLSKIDAEQGTPVRAGDQIGEVGLSGVAIGSHLHFEIRRGNVEDFYSTLNPELWLIPTGENVGALALSVVNQDGQYHKTAITLQRYSHASGQPVEAYYFDTYHPSLALGEENAGMGDLPAGRYRIALIFNGNLYERWVDVESGKLTQAVIVVK
jgi:hypothetical protein